MFAVMGSVNGADCKICEKQLHSYDIATTGCSHHGINPRTLTIKAEISPELQLPILALDIGGSLAKVAYVSQDHQNELSGRLSVHMISYRSEDIDDYLAFIRQRVLRGVGAKRRLSVHATGVGCTKYRHRISQALGIDLHTDGAEMEHTLEGVDFLWRHLPSDQLLYEGSEENDLRFGCSLAESGVTPCILVSLGSALLIHMVDKDGKSCGMVGASTQGGLTLLGLGALLTNTQSFKELVELGEKGDRTKVDLLVKDVAGSDYNTVASDCMVSSFGKIVHKLSGKTDCDVKREDLASSLLYMITEQMAQTSYFVAKCNNVSKVIFNGSYLTHNSSAIDHIREKFTNCSLFLGTEIKPYFLRQESYPSVLGLLSSQLQTKPTVNGCHS